MRPKAVAFAALLLFSCQQKTAIGHIPEGNREKIVRLFNQVKSLETDATDTAGIGKMDRLAAGLPSEYKAMASIAHGIASASASSYELARKYYETALWQAQRPSADTLKAFALTGIGNSYKHTGDYPKAFDSFYKAGNIRKGFRPSIPTSVKPTSRKTIFPPRART
jgi:tetratricopeptide (TPR) repeat protein